MKLSLEVPSAYTELSQLADFDFVLSHKVLEDSYYAEYFRERPMGRELILDNSMHELGESLSVNNILLAAVKCRADYIVPPDRLGDARWTVQQYFEMRSCAGLDYRVAAVHVGTTPEERRYALEAYWSADMLCFPYKEPRLEWWSELPSSLPWRRVHLLGMNELDELAQWALVEKIHEAANPVKTVFSIDTGKPVKWGIERRSISSAGSLRHSKIASKELLDVGNLDAEQLRLIRENIEYLRSFLYLENL